jgi:hypothetical protein
MEMAKNRALKYIAGTFVRHLRERNQALESMDWSNYNQASGFCIGIQSTIRSMAYVDEDLHQFDAFLDKVWELCRI